MKTEILRDGLHRGLVKIEEVPEEMRENLV